MLHSWIGNGLYNWAELDIQLRNRVELQLSGCTTGQNYLSGCTTGKSYSYPVVQQGRATVVLLHNWQSYSCPVAQQSRELVQLRNRVESELTGCASKLCIGLPGKVEHRYGTYT